MKLKINISEEKYNQIINHYKGSNVRPKDYEIAIINGTVLPEDYKDRKNDILDKIEAEIKDFEEGITSYHNDRPWIFKDEVLEIIDKYKENEGQMTREEYEIVKTRNYLRAIKEAMKTGKIESYDEWFEAIDKVIELFNEKREGMKALEQEYDCISRHAVLALAKEECETAIIPYRKFVKDVNALPPVTLQPKTGQWIYDDEHSSWSNLKYKCSCCKREIIVRYEAKDGVYQDFPYCHCGTKMVESEE